MATNANNVIVDKSYKFSLRMIKAYQYLCEHQRTYALFEQMLRSGTSIGANVKEGVQAQSKADFVAKLSIALKEASETEYWLELFRDSDFFSKELSESILADCVELIKLLTSILKSSKGLK